MEEKYLDAVLVPSGLIVLVGYHLWLLRRIICQPKKTVMGINAINRRVWVQFMMQDPGKTGVLAVQTLRNNIMASTLLASMAIMLGSVIAVLMANGWGTSGPSAKVKSSEFIYGNSSDVILSFKFFCILTSFLLAFLFNVQSIRYYSHGGVLVNVPVKWHGHQPITTDYVAKALNRASYFWSLGLRAFYLSFPLFLWLFGPIPMFVCCLVMSVLLYFLDVSFERDGNGGEGVAAADGLVAPVEC